MSCGYVCSAQTNCSSLIWPARQVCEGATLIGEYVNSNIGRAVSDGVFGGAVSPRICSFLTAATVCSAVFASLETSMQNRIHLDEPRYAKALRAVCTTVGSVAGGAGGTALGLVITKAVTETTRSLFPQVSLYVETAFPVMTLTSCLLWSIVGAEEGAAIANRMLGTWQMDLRQRILGLVK
jgi:hypothetical protein